MTAVLCCWRWTASRCQSRKQSSMQHISMTKGSSHVAGIVQTMSSGVFSYFLKRKQKRQQLLFSFPFSSFKVLELQGREPCCSPCVQPTAQQPGWEGKKMTMSPCPLGNTCSKFCVHSRAGWSAPAGQVRAQEVKGHGCKGGGNPAPCPCSLHAPPPFPSADGELAKFLPRNTELLGSASSPCSERSVITELRSEGNPAAACSVL